ncbi:ATP-binding protein [Lysobacter sp. 5GHs7-4]|uniref:sensor histidine kinase n=1 Tax=Lysobacter sp. 5GHs7-4 TaxID=2904253 RepID=UPI001E629913|nr:ATP-binding protein [Lysobacter sp. 5GHs7-4]UHQ23425.1 ATP-binding protein [Lysobacter sp. 5GHs7-4]
MTEAAAQETGEDRFRMAMQASGIGMAIVDLQGRWVEVNPVLERLLGFDARDMVGRPAAEFTHPDDVALSRGFLEGLTDGAIPALDVRKRYLRRDGSPVWTHANVAVVRGPDNAPRCLLVQIRDIGAQVEAEAQAQTDAGRYADALDASNRHLQLFADAVAHDLRAPLRSIESFSGLLADRAAERLDETDRDYLDRIRAAAGRMTALLAALNELSHVTRTAMRQARVDLSLLADWVGAELLDADPHRRADIRVQPGLYVEGDERLLKLLLTQLMGNAWKFSRERDPIRIEISGERADGRLRVGIRDYGSGFDMRYVHKLFEPFQRLHGPDQGGGHGLGLAIAKRIADRHRGQIQVQSTPDVGSLFTVELPAAVGEETAHA